MKKILSILLIGVLIIVSGCSSNNVNESKQKTSVYSWNRELFDDLSVMEQLSDYRIDRIHQGFFPSDFEGDEMPDLVSALRKQGIETAALFGENWSDADQVIEWTIKPLAEYNDRVGKKARINSAVYDIEWYTSGEVDEEHFADYVSLMTAVCTEAHEKGLEVIAVIPYWLPTLSTELFKQLISQVDEISLMNYIVGKEADHLVEINALAAEAGVKVESAFETQPVGGDVTESITYNQKGKDALIKAAEELREKCNVGIAYHHLSALLELK